MGSIGGRLASAAAGGNIFTSIGASLGGRYAGETLAGGGEKVFVSENVIRLDSGEIVTVQTIPSENKSRKVGQRVVLIQSGEGYRIQ